jgi:membrane protein involved in colicin uptake
MSLRRFATGAALAIAGLVAAVGIGLLANSISGDNVGLSAEPLSAGETLAPKADDRARDRAKQRAARERARKRAAARRRAQREAAQQPADSVEVPAPGPTPTTTTFDDHGGLRDGSDDNSGSGSGSSGSGSGGSDDSGKIDDD